MNFRLAFVVISCLLVISGCSVSGKYRSDGACKGFHSNPQRCERASENFIASGKIKIGQSLAEVLKIMVNSPDEREATADDEKLTYLTDYENEIYLEISFKQGIVSKIKQSKVNH